MKPCFLRSFQFFTSKAVFCLFPLLCNVSLGQVDIGGYSVTRYTDENGLPQNSVNSIAPDANGFLWLASEDGLVRFDGQSFFVFEKTILKTADNSFAISCPGQETLE